MTSKMTDAQTPIQAAQQMTDHASCHQCGDPVLADDLCTDCYWNRDQELKKARRASPEWRFQRAHSFATTCLGMKEEAAITYALNSVDKFLDELEKKNKVD